jgi:hypothetical protein
VGQRLWGLPPLLMGLYLLLVSRERFEHEAERDARRVAKIFPWTTERMIKSEVRNQLLLRRVVPPLFVAFGALVLLGVIDLGES